MDSEEALLKRADKKAQGHALSFITGGPDFNEAAGLYTQAGNKYKMKKQFKEASECFLKVAFMQQKMNDYNSEASAYVEAANLIKKYSPRDAAEYYNKATDIYNNAGRFSQSAKMMKGLAELFETENDFAEAVKFYQKAAEFSEMDEYGKSQYSQCIIKFADLSARHIGSDLRASIRVYEKEGEKALRNTLTQFNAKEHFFKAGILLLALNDAIDAKIACDHYEEIDPRFGSSREGRLLRKLVDTFEAQDGEGFVEAIREYDSITKLDSWKVCFLNQVKEFLVPTKVTLDSSYVEDDQGNVDLT